MEIIDDHKPTIVEDVKSPNTMAFEEVFPDQPLSPRELKDRDLDVFEEVKAVVKETGMVQSTEIASRLNYPTGVIYPILYHLWRAGLIRRFLKVRFRMSKAQPGKSQAWYVINKPKEFVLPEVNKPASRRGMYLTHKVTHFVPDETIAAIRRFPPEVKTDAIAQKFDLSISYTEMVRNYHVRKNVKP